MADRLIPAIPKMRAAVITAPLSAEVREVPRPKPRMGEVLVQIEGCGLCGSNLPVWEGRPWFAYPTLPPGSPGHEGWGRVCELGYGVSTVEIGQRVAFLSNQALAEFDIARDDELLTLPESLDDVDVPGEPLGCAMNTWRRSDIRRGQTVAVVGAGFLGSVLIQLAVWAGARVIAISRRGFSRQLAKRLGAVEAAELGDDTAAEILELTGGKGCERVIEAVGNQRALDVATSVCSVRGRLIIAGFHQDGPRQIDLRLWNWRGLDVINAHERDSSIYIDGMRAAADAVVSHRLDLDPLLTHRVPLDDVARGFELLRTRPDGFVKALVIP